MVEIFVVAYMVIGLLATVLLWKVLMISKRLDASQSMETESLEDDRFFESKTESINFYSS